MGYEAGFNFGADMVAPDERDIGHGGISGCKAVNTMLERRFECKIGK